jgi:RNA polymerase sigma-70 factor, ECF subfamily
MTGEDQQFQQIYEDFHARILRYLSRMVGEVEAEDLAQDVFVKIGLDLENFRGDSQLSTWIYRVATNTAIDRLRRKGKDLHPEFSLPGDEKDPECIPEGVIEIEERVIRQEMNGCIRAVIDILPEAYRSVIILSELEGFQDSEIAEILSVSLQTAKIRLHRARTRLRKELQKACVFYRNGQGEFACDRK